MVVSQLSLEGCFGLQVHRIVDQRLGVVQEVGLGAFHLTAVHQLDFTSWDEMVKLELGCFGWHLVMCKLKN